MAGALLAGTHLQIQQSEYLVNKNIQTIIHSQIDSLQTHFTLNAIYSILHLVQRQLLLVDITLYTIQDYFNTTIDRRKLHTPT